jgi:hypothetical protein
MQGRVVRRTIWRESAVAAPVEAEHGREPSRVELWRRSRRQAVDRSAGPGDLIGPRLGDVEPSLRSEGESARTVQGTHHGQWPLGNLGSISSFGDDVARDLYVVVHQGRMYRLE